MNQLNLFTGKTPVQNILERPIKTTKRTYKTLSIKQLLKEYGYEDIY